VIVLSFGVVRLLDGALASFPRDAEWNFVFFLAQLATPVILYLQASTLVTSSPDSIEDWRIHFYAIRRRFFGLNIAFGAVTPLASRLPTGLLAPSVPFVAIAVAIVVLSGIALRSDSHRIQAMVVLLLALLNFVAIAILIMAPQQFGRAA
jgi:hypothetical protein